MNDTKYNSGFVTVYRPISQIIKCKNKKTLLQEFARCCWRLWLSITSSGELKKTLFWLTNFTGRTVWQKNNDFNPLQLTIYHMHNHV